MYEINMPMNMAANIIGFTAAIICSAVKLLVLLFGGGISLPQYLHATAFHFIVSKQFGQSFLSGSEKIAPATPIATTRPTAQTKTSLAAPGLPRPKIAMLTHMIPIRKMKATTRMTPRIAQKIRANNMNMNHSTGFSLNYWLCLARTSSIPTFARSL